MYQDKIKSLIQPGLLRDGLTETGISGVKLFRATAPVPCAPAVYEPCVIVIVSGTKEAVLDGRHVVYDASQYMCCPLSLPAQAGTPTASPEDPLLGILISLDRRTMAALAMDVDNLATPPLGKAKPLTAGLRLANWDPAFGEALFRLLQLMGNATDMAVLAEARLREVFYAVLKGDAGQMALQAFRADNAITTSISHLATCLNAPVSVDDLAARAGMSRAVFHRKFKEATTMSPIQYVKSMRLGSAAMQIAGGVPVSKAATNVGYISTSQFTREFKRKYGHAPRQWSAAQQATIFGL